MELLVVLVIGAIVLGALILASRLMPSSSSSSGGARAIHTVAVNQRPSGIRTVSAGAGSLPGRPAGQIAIVQGGFQAAVSTDLECGWCGRTSAECVSEGRGPVQACTTRGCLGRNCQRCLDTYGHRCSGACGARHR